MGALFRGQTLYLSREPPLPFLGFLFSFFFCPFFLSVEPPFCSSSVCFPLFPSALLDFLVRRSPCKTFRLQRELLPAQVDFTGFSFSSRLPPFEAFPDRKRIGSVRLYTRGVWRTLLRGLPLLERRVGFPRGLVFHRGFPLLRFPFPSPSHPRGVSPFPKRFRARPNSDVCRLFGILWFSRCFSRNTYS